MSSHGSNKEMLDRVQQRAGDIVEGAMGNCAQATFIAVSEEFGLGNGDVVKSLTAMPGIALQGETCGTVVGALAVLGVYFGRGTEGPLGGFAETHPAAGRFCRDFEKEFGTLKCKQLHTSLCGKTYDFSDMSQMQEFMLAGGLKLCRAPAGKAARIVAGLILEKEE